MDQIVSLPELDYSHAKDAAREFGYGREAIAFLGLSRIKGVGFQTLQRLGGRHGISELLECRSVEGILHRLAERGARVARDGSFPSEWEDFRQRLWQIGRDVAEPLISQRIRFLFDDDACFPRKLREMPDMLRPQWLFVAGSLELLDRPALALVGTRKPSASGEFLARYAVSCAQELGAPVVSGLAEGIDRLVHEWCLHVSLPTVSVLGTGISVPYPAHHAPLSDAILAAGGTVITEYLPDQGPSGQQFVWRNRLQAALGCATIPVEWKRRSGTAHTVRFSRKLGRPVFGMTLGGMPVDPEDGESDQHFTVPSEHSILVDALRRSLLTGTKVPEIIQPDLFA